MKRVYTSDSVPMAWHIRNVLQQHGVHSVVKNDSLYSIAGEIPLTECMPEVWVCDSLYAKYAEKIIKQVESTHVGDRVDWRCLKCDEANFANFGICWNCGVEIED